MSGKANAVAGAELGIDCGSQGARAAEAPCDVIATKYKRPKQKYGEAKKVVHKGKIRQWFIF